MLHSLLGDWTFDRVNIQPIKSSKQQRVARNKHFFAHHSKIHKSLFYGKVLTRVHWREAKRPGMAKTPVHCTHECFEWKRTSYKGNLNTNFTVTLANVMRTRGNCLDHRWNLVCAFEFKVMLKFRASWLKINLGTLLVKDLICEQRRGEKSRPDLYLSGQFRTQRWFFTLNPLPFPKESMFEYFLSIGSCCLRKFMIY